MPRATRPASPARTHARTRPAARQSPAEAPARVVRLPRPAAGPPRSRRSWLRLLRWGFIATVWGALVLACVVLWFAWDMPRPDSALHAVRRPSLTLQDRTGHIFASFGDVVGQPMRLGELPPYVPKAVVAVEDHRFWQDPGIDPIGILRAAWTDLLAWRVVEGGSTITQQVAKTLFLSNARTLRRKVQELLLTFWLERHFTKRQILEIYLNRVYLGSGTFGIDAAAHVYFGVSARRLTLWQAAVLAGLPRAPSRFNPHADPRAAKARAKQVLAAMVRAGDITEARARLATARIVFPPPRAAGAGWFGDWAADQAESELPPGTDASLRTTLDPRLQTVAQDGLTALLNGPGVADHVGQGAVVVLDATTGAVRAMVGGRDYVGGGYNRAVEARRQPGSAFKPFTWLAALEAGKRPDDTVLDAPIRIGNWQPHDFDRHYLGRITLETALADSINTAAVRLLLDVGGPRRVAAVAARLGITDHLPDDPSLALGTGEVGLLELAAAYAPFFNGGWRVTPWGVDSFPHPRKHVITPEQAAMMDRMLTAVVTRGTGRAAAVPGYVVAGKTGTTEDFRDAWFIGCIGGEIIGVWMGNDDDRPTKGVVGGDLPARLFHRIALAVR